MSGWLDRLVCRVKGHTAMLTFAPGRLALRCDACGWESPGWDIGRPAVPERQKVQSMNLQIVRGSKRRAA